MPPPKKPKTGPTSVEQFMSNDELQKLEPGDSSASPSQSQSPTSETIDNADIKTECSSSEVEFKRSSSKILLDLFSRASSDSKRDRPELDVDTSSMCIPDNNRRYSQSSHGSGKSSSSGTPTSPDAPSGCSTSFTQSSDTNGFLNKNGNDASKKAGDAFSTNGCDYGEIAVRNPVKPKPSLMHHFLKATTEPTSFSSTYSPLSGVQPFFTQSNSMYKLSSQRAFVAPSNGPYDLSTKRSVFKTEQRDDTSMSHVSSHLTFNSVDARNSAFTAVHRPFNKESETSDGQEVSNNLSSKGNNSTSFSNAINLKLKEYFPLIFRPPVWNNRDASDVKPSKEDERNISQFNLHSLLPAASQTPSSTTPEAGESDLRYPLMMEHTLSSSSLCIPRKIEPQSGSCSNKLCQVCSDIASGFHYGVWSCEGCKAFFKRSIQGPVDYVCPATNTCTIDKHRRKSCQACRLRKCMEVGMNKGTQRKERRSSCNAPKTPKRSRMDSMEGAVNSTSGGPPLPKLPRNSRITSLIDSLVQADLPEVESLHNPNQPPTKANILESLVRLADRKLVHLINWAKHVPGYTDLSLSDQVHLIECCWMELLLLNVAYRSTNHDGRGLEFAPDLILERYHWNVIGMSDILEQISAVSEQMVQYNIHREEFLILQATVLVNAEVRRLESYHKMSEIKQMLLDALLETAHRYHADYLKHVPSILLLLTHVRQAGERAIAYFQDIKNEGIVTFCDLLREMLDADNSTNGIDRKPDMHLKPQ